MKKFSCLGLFSILCFGPICADDDLQREYYGRIEVLEQKIKDLEGKLGKLLQLAENAEQQEKKEQKSAEIGKLIRDKSDQDIVVEIKKHVNKKDFGEAIEIAGVFLDQRSSSIYCGMVIYYKGKSFFRQGNYESAASAFMDSYEKNKQGAKAPKALFLLAECFDKLNKQDKRKIILKKIVQNYEGHRYAKKAAKALASSE